MRRFMLAVVAASSAFVAACSGSASGSNVTPSDKPGCDETPCENRPGIGGVGANADAGEMPPVPPPPPACDGNKLPAEDSCVVHEAYGVFVSSSRGAAGAPGSRTQPIASLAEAIKLAQQTNRRVYVCAEAYGEALAIADGVSMFGAFDCSAWAYGTGRARIAPSASPAATADKVTKPTRIEGFEIVAPDASAGQNGESSIAMIARQSSSSLVLASSTLRAQGAGSGRAGKDGVTATDVGTGRGEDGYWDRSGYCVGALGCAAAIRRTRGGTSDCRVNGQPVPSLSGGHGGYGGEGIRWNYGFSNISGFYQWIPTPAEEGEGGTATTAPGSFGGTHVNGQDGAIGKAGTNGANGSAFGSLTQNGYVPADGGNGTDGAGGQGGGGAGGEKFHNVSPGTDTSATYFDATGAAGGAGGCGGQAGTGGGGGGASLALLAFDSPITLAQTTLETGKGGAGRGGGGGAGGLPGQPGGFYARRENSGSLDAATGAGGNGGAGGPGGYGGVGGGGPSIAIVFRGAAPARDRVTVRLGAPGLGAVTGMAVEQYQAP